MSALFNSLKKYLAVVAALLFSAPAWAGGPPAENPLLKPLAILLISVMIILLIVIGILGAIVTGAADITLMKWKKSQEQLKNSPIGQVAAIFVGCMLLSPALFAQGNTGDSPTPGANEIGGLTSSAFYLMVTVIFLELLVILVLLINVRLLIKSQKKELTVAAPREVVARKPRVSWWSRFNKLKPLEQEADLDLGHDYDGIRELNNRLPPWWIYGFYVTIIFAAIYLWRYHVSHTAPLSKEEYEMAVQNGERQKNEYLKAKGESVDENTVTMLAATDIAEGKKIFVDATKCASCHGADGSGMVNGNPGVGPNLTDDYWLHGGDIKSIFKTIKYGIDGKGMPAWGTQFSAKQLAQLASFVKSVHGTKPANGKTPQGELYKDDGNTQGSIDSTSSAKNKKLASN